MFLWGSIALLISGGCNPSKDWQPPYLGESIQVNFGEIVTVGDDLSIHFFELLGDSRCPDGALCPWEGEAKISVRLRTEQFDTLATELRIRGFITSVSQNGHETVQIEDYKLTLIQLDPYPILTHNRPKQSYTATLVIEKTEL